MKILVVDDEATTRRALARELAGHTVFEADGVPSALAVLERESWAIDAVVSDLEMPVRDGISLLREVYQRAPFCARLLVSGSERLALHSRDVVIAHSYIAKPWRRAEVLDAVVRATELLRIERQKHDLTALIIHDLKNPLASILCNADYLVSLKSDDADALESARDIHTSAVHMQRMIMNLLDISRSDDGALVPRLAPLDAGALVAAVVAQSAVRAAAEHKTLAARVAACPTGRGDVDLLHRVLENLIDNSIKYTSAGATIQVEAAAEQDGGIQFRVRDDGPGISPEHRSSIFQKYVRSPGEASNLTRTSRGLGLAFCRVAVEAHGGRIWVEDNLPHGVVFCLRLPPRFDVYADGAGLDEPARDAAASAIAGRLALSRDRVMALLGAGPVRVWSCLPREVSEKLVKVLCECGVRAKSWSCGERPPEAAVLGRGTAPAEGTPDVTTQRVRAELGSTRADCHSGEWSILK